MEEVKKNEEQRKGKEAYEQRKREKEQAAVKTGKGSAAKSWLKVVVIVMVIVGALGAAGWWFATSGIGKFSVTGTCIDHSPQLAMHIHPHVRIIIDGEEQKISEGIGIKPLCMRPVHTHDDAGTIHLEAPQPHIFTLDEFFTMWEKPFSQHQILDWHADDTHEIILTVDGQPSDAYENLVLQDKQSVVIEYRKKE